MKNLREDGANTCTLAVCVSMCDAESLDVCTDNKETVRSSGNQSSAKFSVFG